MKENNDGNLDIKDNEQSGDHLDLVKLEERKKESEKRAGDNYGFGFTGTVELFKEKLSNYENKFMGETKKQLLKDKKITLSTGEILELSENDKNVLESGETEFITNMKNQFRTSEAVTLSSGRTVTLNKKQKRVKNSLNKKQKRVKNSLRLTDEQECLLLDEYYVQRLKDFQFTQEDKVKLLECCRKQFKTCELLLFPVAFGEEINVRQEDIASCSLDEIRTKYKLDKFYNMHKALEECKKYNKLMWRKYSNLASKKYKFEEIDEEDPVFMKYKKDFENDDYTIENFKYQCECYSNLIDAYIRKYHLKPPEKKRAALIFFWTLALLAIVFWGFCMFAPTLSISAGVWLGISEGLVCQIIYASQVLAAMVALFFCWLGKHISWKQNDYDEKMNPEVYSRYNDKFEIHKQQMARLTGERGKKGEYEYNTKNEGEKCPFFHYYHQVKVSEEVDKNTNKKSMIIDNYEPRKNTKTPLELLLELKKAYEIREEFQNTSSIAYGIKDK